MTDPKLKMDKLLTVIIQTSPLPSHPSTALIEALFRSFDKVKCLKDCSIVILCDGCDAETAEPSLSPSPSPSPSPSTPPPSTTSTTSTTTPTPRPTEVDEGELINDNTKETEENGKSKHKTNETTNNDNFKHGTVSQNSATNYRHHLQLLHTRISSRQPPFHSTNNGTIQLLQLPHRHGSARAIVAAFQILNIATPYVLIGQHDNFFVRDVDYLECMMEYMEREENKDWLQCVHFPSTATLNYVQKVKRRYQLDLEPFCKRILNQTSTSKQQQQQQQQNYDATTASSSASSSSSSSLCGEFIPLVFWYGRTHIARTAYYTERILVPKFHHPLKVKDHLEEIWGVWQLRETMELNHKNKKKETILPQPKCDDGEEEEEEEEEDESCFEMLFRKCHAEYGNYVFFDHDGISNNGDYQRQEQREVLYHFSGRKAHAVTATSVKVPRSLHENVKNKNGSDSKEVATTFHPKEKSFTTARRAMAVVPGLEFIPSGKKDGQEQRAISKRSKFRQRCFRCGEKGHSFKFVQRLQKIRSACQDGDSRLVVSMINVRL